jgi:hypothetical protein
MNRLPEIPTKLIFRMLEVVIPEINAQRTRDNTMTSFYVEKAFEALDQRSDAPLQRIGALEYAFFPLLEYDNRPLRIHKLMAADPVVYHQFLRNAFLGESEVVSDATEDAKSRAQRSYALLSHFSVLPGLTENGLDVQALRTWIDEVRRLGVETDRAAVTDSLIGRLLAHAPFDADGGWPHKAVRDEIERIQSENLERGLQIERFNMRGVNSRGMFEGGDQERALADDNLRWADIAAVWPRTSALLQAIAKNWRLDAEREDIQAAQRKLRS